MTGTSHAVNGAAPISRANPEHSPARRSGRLRVTLALLALLPLAAWSHRDGPARWVRVSSTIAPPSPAAADRAVFRLGNAGQPFAWSSVIGDFNADGVPDVAIADHAGRRRGQFAYRLEFAVSGQRPDQVTFLSQHDAITVRLADVDRDNDLDVIVGAPLSDETISIWLNDGHGHFSAGAVPTPSASVGPIDAIDAGECVPDFIDPEAPDRRFETALGAVCRAPLPFATRRRVPDASRASRSVFLPPQTNPRAPPVPGFDSLL